MSARILLTFLIILAVWGGYRLLSWTILSRRTKDIVDMGDYRPGSPGILWFTSPHCVPCKTIQQPILERIEEIFKGDLQVLRVDASQNPKLADAWGVLSLPTTFIIDRQGQPRRVNHGVVREHLLLAQLAEIEEFPPQYKIKTKIIEEGLTRRSPS